ncbi:MAG: hypothetical protein ACOX2I_13045 [Candidatus Ozemobacteraceae bacterium]|jgi:Tfp pilus assembly protein FimT
MGKPILGVTLVELLLVVALMAVIAPIVYPYAFHASAEWGEISVKEHVKVLISQARQMGIAGRSVNDGEIGENTVVFVKDTGDVKIGEKTFQIASGFVFEEDVTIVFSLEGQPDNKTPIKVKSTDGGSFEVVW